MSAVEILRTLIASYLIATLGATALAKLRNRRVSSVGMQRERVIPARAAPAVIVTVAFAELSLATLLMLGAAPVATGIATAALFVLFAGYRLLWLSQVSRALFWPPSRACWSSSGNRPDTPLISSP